MKKMYDYSEKIPDYNSFLPSNLFKEKEKENEVIKEDDISDSELTNCSKVIKKYLII